MPDEPIAFIHFEPVIDDETTARLLKRNDRIPGTTALSAEQQSGRQSKRVKLIPFDEIPAYIDDTLGTDEPEYIPNDEESVREFVQEVVDNLYFFSSEVKWLLKTATLDERIKLHAVQFALRAAWSTLLRKEVLE